MTKSNIIIDNIERGDHIKVSRLGYSHHGMYLGDDQVIHYLRFQEDDSTKKRSIYITSLNDFACGNPVKVIPHKNAKFNVDERIERAKSKLGEDKYNLFSNNCEHFVNWCINDKKASKQVNTGFWSFAAATFATTAYLIAKNIRKR